MTGYVTEVVDSRLVRPRERCDWFTDLVSSYHCEVGVDLPRSDDFRMRASRQVSPRYQLVSWQQDAECVVLRSRRQVRRDPDDAYRLLLPIRGTLRVRQEDTEIALPSRVGSLVTLDAALTMWCGRDLRCVIMSIPRHEIESRTGVVPVAAVDMTSGLGRVVRDMQATLTEERASLSRFQFDAVCDRVVDLLCMVIAGDTRPDAEGHHDDVAATIRRHVREHASDRHLNGTAIAHALGWSLRKIQLVLERAGTTPRDLIREERLRLAREHLLSPAYRHLTIASIAHNSGFGSVSAFSTAFRRRYGLAPRDLRNHLPLRRTAG